MSSPEAGGPPRNRNAAAKRRTLSREIREEPDRQWRAWFEEVERRKKRLASPKGKALRVVPYDKDGVRGVIERRKSVPVPLKSFLTKNRKKAGESLNSDMLVITAAWKKAVGNDVAADTEVYSFKNGVLTVSVFSSPLLQEIRQFHSTPILEDLREIWTASQPLVKITYRLGKR